VFTVSTTGTDSPVDLGLDPNGTDPLPFFDFSGVVIFHAIVGSYGGGNAIWIKADGVPSFVYSPFYPIDFYGGNDYEGFVFFTNGGHVRKLYYTDPGTVSDFGTGNHPKFPMSLFCNQIVFDDQGEIILASYAGERFQLTDNADQDSQPALSPGQEKVVFVSDREGNQDLFMMDADGTDVVNLTNTPDIDESMPDWSL
ncbi:MAG: TolB family protein, partial [Candidatus Sericytochromatia bacterium]